jgi:copper chaperone
VKRPEIRPHSAGNGPANMALSHENQDENRRNHCQKILQWPEVKFFLDLPSVGRPILDVSLWKEVISMYEFKVEGMSCNHCVQSLTKALTKLDSRAKVEVDLATKLVKVESVEDPKTLAAEIEEAGYTVLSTRTV